MSNIVQFPDRTAKARNQGDTLCRRGFHKWVIDKQPVFDTKAGQLVTTQRCSRCGKTETRST
ncbi:MAG TPA: hypothetical protein EYN73_10130 [Chromatiaceae bacterium]|nr:hypothetical protein [Chromatiaceae bacterium]HIB83358.1 hypothetical protein [Chromatiaceae bacterium]HIN83015.1 hypothetical protein [Chromatiales bacterium]HIO15038.1 hypothetical protein [Chromatiales bacterium]HIO54361.1 hypothetical protein [Chromatiales bacterium]